MLSQINPHPRDQNIIFAEENHEYTIAGMLNKPISVTTLIHKYFPEFDADVVIKKMMASRNWPQSKYFGRTPESIKKEWEENGDQASQLGTIMHKSIEQFFNQEPVSTPNSKEFVMFMQFWRDFTTKYPMMRPYRSEWLVYDEDISLAGSIDLVVSDPKGNLIIVDWKRSKEIKIQNNFEKGKVPFQTYPNCNYSHYSLQLNFYRTILEKCYDKTVIFMMLVILHPNQENYICYPVPRIELDSIWLTLTQK